MRSIIAVAMLVCIALTGKGEIPAYKGYTGKYELYWNLPTQLNKGNKIGKQEFQYSAHLQNQGNKIKGNYFFKNYSGTTPKNILFIVAKLNLISGDSAIKQHLEEDGHLVIVESHLPGRHPANLTGIDLILIAQNVTVGNLTDKYKNASIPVVLCSSGLLPFMGMTGNISGVDFGTTSSQRNLNFLTTGHPVSNGLSGNLEVATASRTFQWGLPGAGAASVAHLLNAPTQFGIFLYDQSAILADGSLATGKRGFLWLQNNAFTVATPNALLAFDNMINWALASTVAPPDTEAPSVPTGLAASSIETSDFVLNWLPSTDNVGVSGYYIYLNGTKTNGSPVASASFQISGLLPNTTYTLSVSALDAAGNESVPSGGLTVTTLPLPLKRILFIVGNTTLNSGDNGIKARLQSKGYGVTVIRHDSNLHPTNVAGIDLILISATSTSDNLTNKYKNTSLPLITLEPFILGDMGMTGLTATVDYGNIPNQSQLDFISPLHPVTLGLSGAVAVNNVPSRYVWGVPGGQGRVLARIAGNANQSGVFVYEQGTLLADNTSAANRRGFLWLFDDTFDSLNGTGLGVFDIMVEWGLGNLIVPDIDAPGVPQTLSASSIKVNSFTLGWQPSTDNVGVTGYDVYQNGAKINTTPVTGTSLPVAGLTAGTNYQMTVVAIDAAGNQSAASSPLSVTTLAATAKNILFVVGNTTLNSGDNAIRNRLLATGYTVNIRAHTSSLHPAPLAGVDLVLISSTVAPGNLTSRYKGANVPVIICEPFILDDMGMTGVTSGVHYGTTLSQTQLNFTNPSHPVSNGVSGLQFANNAERDFNWGVPNAQGSVIALMAGSSNRAGVFLYEKGRLLPDNSLSANKRGFMWLFDNTFVTVSSIGETLFDRMLQWGVGTIGGGDVEAPSAPLSLVSSNLATTSFTLSWNVSTDNVGVTGYDVYRNGTKINASPVSGNSFAVTGLAAATTYQMTVMALDAAGNQSVASAPLAVTTLLLPGSEPFTMRTVIASQSSPWDITWGPDNQIWYTERTAGRVARVNPATGAKQTLLTLGSNMVQLGGQDGLLGMAIHPEFNSGKPFVYIAYTYQSLSATVGRTRIQRYTFNSGTQVLESPVTILENISGSNDHNGGRMAIGPDLKLYYAIGDMGAGQFDNAARANNAQALNVLEGKVLRLNLETISSSWIPTDNPFTDGATKTAVYSLGHRNPQGLVWGNVNGQNRLYGSEHGPFSDDEVNSISSGANYGWPQVIGLCDGNYNGRTTGGFSMVNEVTNCSTLNSIEPIFSMFAVPTPPTSSTNFSTWPSVAPSGMDFYSQTNIPGWQHSLLIATLKNGTITRLKLNTDGSSIVGDTIHYFRGMGRFRDVIVSPDGTKIYAACDNTGNTSGPTGGVVTSPPNPGSILEFTFTGTVPPVGMITQLASEKVFEAPENKVHVYPNPAKGQLIVKLENWMQASQVALTTLDGKPARQAFVTAKETRIPLDYLNGGIYILRVIGKDGRNMATEKVMVIK